MKSDQCHVRVVIFLWDRLVSFLSVISVLLKVCPVPVPKESAAFVFHLLPAMEQSINMMVLRPVPPRCWHSADSDTMDGYALLFSSHFPELKQQQQEKERAFLQSGDYDFTFHCMPHSTAKNKENNNKNKPFPSFFCFLFFQLIVHDC